MAFLPEFVHYSRNERRGIVALLLLIISLAIIPKMLPWFVKNKPVDFSEFEQYLAGIETSQYTKNTAQEYFIFDPNTLSKDSLQLLGLSPKTAQTIINYRKKGGQFSNKKALQKIYGLNREQYDLIEPFIAIKRVGNTQNKNHANSKKKIPKRFSFDPNSCNEQELLSLGIPKKVVKTLLKFRSKGGHFRTKKDLQKIYGLSENLYASLAPYIQINEQSFTEKYIPSALPSFKNEIKTPIFIDINKASAEEWQDLKGIGPSYANRIVRFRDKLGGFSSIDQIGATYGFPDSIFQKIKPYLTPSPVFRKLTINTASLDDLKAHPFLNWSQAKTIISYRQNHGHFKSIDDLSKIKVLNPETIKKLQPYLKFD